MDEDCFEDEEDYNDPVKKYKAELKKGKRRQESQRIRDRRND